MFFLPCFVGIAALALLEILPYFVYSQENHSDYKKLKLFSLGFYAVIGILLWLSILLLQIQMMFLLMLAILFFKIWEDWYGFKIHNEFDNSSPNWFVIICLSLSIYTGIILTLSSIFNKEFISVRLLNIIIFIDR